MPNSVTCKVQVARSATQVSCEPDPPSVTPPLKTKAEAPKSKPQIGPPPPARPAVDKLVEGAQARSPGASKRSVASPPATGPRIGDIALKCASEIDAFALFLLAARSAKPPIIALAGLKATLDVTKCAVREYDAAEQRASDERARQQCERLNGTSTGIMKDGNHNVLVCEVPKGARP